MSNVKPDRILRQTGCDRYEWFRRDGTKVVPIRKAPKTKEPEKVPVRVRP